MTGNPVVCHAAEFFGVGGSGVLVGTCNGDKTGEARARGVFVSRPLLVELTADPILNAWGNNPPKDFPNYAPGAWGPPAAELLMERDSHEWWTDKLNGV